jgi:transcriptional regulator with XRE-family HTH domain
MEEIAKITRLTRKELGISQEEFGKFFGVTRQAVSIWENAISAPDFYLLLGLVNSTHINDWRKEWAKKCLEAYPRRVIPEN